MSQSQTAQELSHTDSIDSQDPNKHVDKKKPKNRRPANTAFRQQRLKAWQPILTPKTVLPLFFAVGIIFAPIGGLLLYASSQVEEISIDYSDCFNQAAQGPTTWSDIPADRVHKYFKQQKSSPQTPQWQHTTQTVRYTDSGVEVPDTIVCSLRFTVENDLPAPVLLYYRLTNFYQNHRRYVKSQDPDQMKGEAKTAEEVRNGGCDPLTVDNATNLPYYPCGLIANSIFNDTISSPVLLNAQSSASNSTTYNMTSRGTAWSSDQDLYKPTHYTVQEAVPPPNWRKRYPAYNSSIALPNLQEMEGFQVWMRTAGLPTFSKLNLRNDDETMTSGRYQIDIWDEFNVTLFGGTKSILISTRTVMGGKNPFLGIAYVVVGGICILLGAIFTATHIIRPRKLGDHTYLTWNNEQPSTATTTGRSGGRGTDGA